MTTTFLVAHSNPIVLIDVEGTLRDGFEGATVRILNEASEIREADLDGLTCLLIEGRAATPDLEPLLAAAEAARVPVAYVGHVPAGSDRGPVIRVPFTSATLLRGVNSLIGSGSAPRP